MRFQCTNNPCCPQIGNCSPTRVIVFFCLLSLQIRAQKTQTTSFLSHVACVADQSCSVETTQKVVQCEQDLI